MQKLSDIANTHTHTRTHAHIHKKRCGEKEKIPNYMETYKNNIFDSVH